MCAKRMWDRHLQGRLLLEPNYLSLVLRESTKRNHAYLLQQASDGASLVFCKSAIIYAFSGSKQAIVPVLCCGSLHYAIMLLLVFLTQTTSTVLQFLAAHSLEIALFGLRYSCLLLNILAMCVSVGESNGMMRNRLCQQIL